MVIRPKNSEIANAESFGSVAEQKRETWFWKVSKRSLRRFLTNSFLALFLVCLGWGALRIGGYLHRIWKTAPVIPRGPDIAVRLFNLDGAASCLITTPSGQNILLDSGSESHSPVEISDILAPNRHLDLVVLTSTKLRCIGGLENMIDDGLVHGAILLPCSVAQFTKSGRTARELIDAAAEHNVYVSGCDQYLLYRNPVLPSSPLLQIATMPISNQSKYHSAMAVRIEYGASSILYAAGLNSSEERVLVGNDSNLSCDVLILGGDQPEAAPLPEMMASSGAAVVALSCDSADPPSAESMRWFAASGASVGRTDILGDFELRLSGAPNQAITWRFEKRSTQKQ